MPGDHWVVRDFDDGVYRITQTAKYAPTLSLRFKAFITHLQLLVASLRLLLLFIVDVFRTAR